MIEIVLSGLVCLHVARSLSIIAALIIYPLAIVAAIVWLATGGVPQFVAGYLVWAALGAYGTMFATTLAIEALARR